LFYLVGDGLAMMTKKDVGEVLVAGLVPHLVEDGGAILQYVDDTILVFEDDLEKSRNVKFILCLFEQISSLKIIFHKIEIYCLDAHRKSRQYSEIFTCPTALPMIYLGMPIDEKSLALS
jgi:hypothetical protein